jgi:hypothetical protein
LRGKLPGCSVELKEMGREDVGYYYVTYGYWPNRMLVFPFRNTRNNQRTF